MRPLTQVVTAGTQKYNSSTVQFCSRQFFLNLNLLTAEWFQKADPNQDHDQSSSTASGSDRTEVAMLEKKMKT